MKNFIYLLILISSSSFVLASSDCNRGDLSSQFCDRDGDMLADTPTNPKS